MEASNVVEIKMNENGEGIVFYNGNNYGMVYWDEDEKQYIYRVRNHTLLDCDQLRAIADKIAHENLYKI